MVFKKLLGSLGVGGPTVDTVLDGPVPPGGTLTGRVRLCGGKADFDVEHVTLEFEARVEAERGDGEQHGTVVFDRHTVAGGFRLAAGEERDVPFAVPVPWETPVTELYGRPLGTVLGVRTELAIAGARDKGDLDPLTVRPLPAQEAVLDAFGRLGFGLRSADLELGHIRGSGQRLPFYQEIEFAPAPQYAYAVNEIEVTFLAAPDGMEVVLEADKRGGFLSAGHDVVTRFHVAHDTAGRDWTAEVESWVQRLVEQHGARRAQRETRYGIHREGRLHDDGSRSGPGMGTVVAAGAAGVAAGVVGGLVAAEVVDEIGDFFEGDDD
ncbi:sporulation protein [Streptomyces mobaraensis]|uniref:Sporulation protein n=1 Tax=Streptomyces mobaraensis TaxID=35621 RepID=A0A5N5W520_STRMB|nr:sporulation protein [Streptomyces mobaraensis]KAB7842191.1 sporulation protein [Streptomyces mobaraensis]